MPIKFLNTVAVDTSVLYVDTINDRVGIGTTSPIDLLALHNSASGPVDSQMNFTTASTGQGVSDGFRIGWNGTLANIFLFEDADMRFATNNTERMRIDSSGNVGIGTSSPSTKLTVNGITTSKGFQTNTTNTNYNLISRNSAGNATLYVQSSTNSTNQPIAQFNYGSATANAGTQVLRVAKDNSYFTNTNVGIGTTSPGAKLDVKDGNSAMRFQEYSNGATLFLDGSDGDFIGSDYFNISAYGATDLAFGYATATKMVIKSTGNVGIGNNTPQAGLSVYKYGSKFTTDSQYIQPSGSIIAGFKSAQNTDNWIGIHGNYGDSTGSANLLLQANFRDVGSQAGHYIGSKSTGLGSADLVFGQLTTNTNINTAPTLTERMRIDSSGNVGIGTTSPSRKLHVNSGTTNEVAKFESTDGTAYLSIMDNSTTSSLQGIGSSGNNLTFYGNNAERMRIDSSGVTHIMGANASVNNSLQFAYNSTAGSAEISAKSTTGNTQFEFYTSNAGTTSERVRIDSNGNVGIGTTSPGQKLEVNGNIKLSETAAATDTDKFVVLDSGVLKYRTGAQVRSDIGAGTGDITGVTAGTYLTGGGTSGNVTINADSTQLAHIHDSSNGTVAAGWITVAQASNARKAGEIYVTDGESGDHSYIRIEWMRSYADSNFTVLNCGGHANRIVGVRVLEETTDKTYGKKYIQVKVTTTSNYYVIVTAPGSIPKYGDFTAETPVLENTKTGYNVKGSQLENLQESSVGTDQGITVGGDLFVDGNAGIGTTSPAAKLDIHYYTSGGNDDLLNVGLDANNPTRAKIYTENYDGNFGLWDSASTQRVKISSDGNSYLNGGNVGIGETSVDAKLHLTAASAGLINQKFESAGSAAWRLGIPASQTYFAFDNANDNLSAPKAVITSGGNVGIGTTNPGAKLQIDSASLGQNINDTTTQAIFNSANANQSNLYIQDYRTAAGNDWTYSGKRIQEKIDSTWMGYMQFNGDSNNGGISFGTGLSTTQSSVDERMRINSSGNVGIGTTSPGAKLDVNGSIKATSGSNFGADNASASIYMGTQDKGLYGNFSGYARNLIKSNSNNIIEIGHISSLVSGIRLEAGSSGVNGTITFATKASERMRIDSSGNVGIGTTSPAAKLVVTDNSNGQNETFKVNHTRSNSDVATRAINVDMNLSGADTTTADRTNYGIFVDLDSSADGDASNEHRIYGVGADVRFTGFSDLARGAYFYAESNNNTEKTAQLAGVYGSATHDSSTTSGGVSNMYGVYGISSIQDLGDVDNSFGGYFSVYIGSARGNADVGVTKAVEGEITIDKASTINYGEMMAVSSIIDNNEGTIPNFGNQYLFKGDYQGTKGSNAYGIYTEGDKHYFDGNVGIGTTSPTAKLHISSAESDPGDLMFLHNSTNASGATIKFTDTAAGTSQFGRITYKHADSQSQGGGASFHFTAEPDTVLVVGDNTNKGRIAVSSAGNVSEVDYGFKDDVNTGLYRAAGDTIGLVTAGSERMRITSAGNVGIGTTSPVEKLEVNGSIKSGNLKIQNSNGGRIGLNRNTATGAIYNNSYGAFQIQNNGTGFFELQSYNSSGSSTGVLSMLESNGNVGIGTTSPSQKLHVSANVRVAGAYYDSNNSPGTSGQVLSSTGTGTDWVDAGGGGGGISGTIATAQVAYGTGTNTIGGEAGFTYNASANTLSVEHLIATDNITVGQEIYHSGDTNTYIQFTTDTIKFVTGARSMIESSTNGTDRVVINEAGQDIDFRVESNANAHMFFVDGGLNRVGINQSVPSYTLDVNGDAKISGTIVDSTNSAGSNNDVLTSTGSGWSWQPASGGSYTPNIVSGATTASKDNLYIFTASATLTLPANPSGGDSIKVSNLSGTTTCVIARNAKNIMAVGQNMTLDNQYASFELIYTDATRGWVIIGAN